jgi:hypothetical protein
MNVLHERPHFSPPMAGLTVKKQKKNNPDFS